MPLISSTISQSPELQHNRKEMYAGEELASNRIEAIPPALDEQIVETNQALPDKSIAFDKLQLDKIKPNQNIGSENFVTGSAGWIIRGDGTAEFNGGGVSVSELHIPDEDTTADSMHVDSDGNTWWGCTATDFAADNDNALAYILKTGVAKFQSSSVNGRTLQYDPVFGDGSDGDVTISSNTTLSRDMFYDNLVVSGTAILTTAGYRIFARTSITLSDTAKIRSIGGNGSAGTSVTSSGAVASTTGGSSGTPPAAGSLPAGLTCGGAGGNGGIITGTFPTAGAAGVAVTLSLLNQTGAAGGAGQTYGAVTGAAGGAAGAVTSVAKAGVKNLTNAALFIDSGSASAQYGGTAGSGAGGGGGYNGAASWNGAGGGGAGANGGYVLLCSPTITIGASAEISVKGGDGGAGGNATQAGAGGGGGAGSGGIVVLIYTTLTNNGTLTYTAGAVGAQGTGTGTGGAAGGTGKTGAVYQLQLL